MPLFSVRILSNVGKSSLTNGYVLLGRAACRKVVLKVSPQRLTTKEFSCFAQKISFSSYSKINCCNCSTKTNINCNEENAQSDCTYDNDGGESQIEETLFKEIANGNAEIEQQLKILQLEIEVLRQDNSRVPSTLKKREWEELLTKPSISSRRRYLVYLFKTEKSREAEKMRKEKKALKRQEIFEEKLKDCHLEYGIKSNTLFRSVPNTSVTQHYNCKLAGALLYSQHVVIDCSYEEYMNKINKKFCAKQLLFSYSELRSHRTPLHVKLCNVNENDEMIKLFKSMLPTASSDKFLWDIHKESYLDLYPKNKLVYLSPHAKQELSKFEHDHIYIIGGFVDRGTGEKVSLAKAKENNIKLAKFPIDSYLHWEKGTKNLTINAVLRILMDMRAYNDWNKAFENIPRRCLHPSKQSYVHENKILSGIMNDFD